MRQSQLRKDRNALHELCDNPAYPISIFSEQFKRLKVVFGHRQSMQQNEEDEFPTSPIYNLCYDATGQLLLTADDTGLVKVWSTLNGALLKTLKGHQGIVNVLQLSDDNMHVITGGDDGTCRIWNLQTGQPMAVMTQKNKKSKKSHIKDQIQEKVLEAFDYQFLQQNEQIIGENEIVQLLICATDKGKIYVYNLQDLETNGGLYNEKVQYKQLKSPYLNKGLQGDLKDILQMDMHPKGYATVSTRSGEIIIWDKIQNLYPVHHQQNNINRSKRHQVVKQKQLESIMWAESRKETNIIQWNKQGTLLLAGSLDGTARLWRWNEGGLLANAGSRSCQTLTYDLDRRLPYTECSALDWSCKSRYAIAVFGRRMKKRNQENDEQTDYNIQVYDTKSSLLLHKLDSASSQTPMISMCLIVATHPHNERVCLSCDQAGVIMIWDIVLGRLLNQFHEIGTHLNFPGLELPILNARFSPDGYSFAVSTNYGRFSIYGYGDPSMYKYTPTEQFFQMDFQAYKVASESDYSVCDEGTGIDVCKQGQGRLCRENKSEYEVQPSIDFQRLNQIGFFYKHAPKFIKKQIAFESHETNNTDQLQIQTYTNQMMHLRQMNCSLQTMVAMQTYNRIFGKIYNSELRELDHKDRLLVRTQILAFKNCCLREKAIFLAINFPLQLKQYLSQQTQSQSNTAIQIQPPPSSSQLQPELSQFQIIMQGVKQQQDASSNPLQKQELFLPFLKLHFNIKKDNQFNQNKSKSLSIKQSTDSAQSLCLKRKKNWQALQQTQERNMLNKFAQELADLNINNSPQQALQINNNVDSTINNSIINNSTIINNINTNNGNGRRLRSLASAAAANRLVQFEESETEINKIYKESEEDEESVHNKASHDDEDYQLDDKDQEEEEEEEEDSRDPQAKQNNTKSANRRSRRRLRRKADEGDFAVISSDIDDSDKTQQSEINFEEFSNSSQESNYNKRKRKSRVQQPQQRRKSLRTRDRPKKKYFDSGDSFEEEDSQKPSENELRFVEQLYDSDEAALKLKKRSRIQQTPKQSSQTVMEIKIQQANDESKRIQKLKKKEDLEVQRGMERILANRTLLNKKSELGENEDQQQMRKDGGLMVGGGDDSQYVSRREGLRQRQLQKNSMSRLENNRQNDLIQLRQRNNASSEVVLNDTCSRCHLENARVHCSNSQCTKLFHEKCAHLSGIHFQTQNSFYCYNCFVPLKQKSSKGDSTQSTLVFNAQCDRSYLTKSTSTSYQPQIQDEVYYLFQGHQQFVSRFFPYLDCSSLYCPLPIQEILPFNTHPCLQTPTLCRVIALDYSFPLKQRVFKTQKTQSNITQNENTDIQFTQILICVKLAFTDNNSQLCEMNLQFAPLQDASPFLIPKDLFEQSMKQLNSYAYIKQQEGQIQFQMQIGSSINGSSQNHQNSKQTIQVERSPFDESVPDSPWKCLKVLGPVKLSSLRQKHPISTSHLSAMGLPDRVSMWEGVYTENNLMPSLQQEQHQWQQYVNLSSSSVFNEWAKQGLLRLVDQLKNVWFQYTQWFENEVSRDLLPDYDQIIPLQMNIDLFVSRIRCNYYRHIQSSLQDVYRICQNAQIYNDTAANRHFIQMSEWVVAWLQKFIVEVHKAQSAQSDKKVKQLESLVVNASYGESPFSPLISYPITLGQHQQEQDLGEEEIQSSNDSSLYQLQRMKRNGLKRHDDQYISTQKQEEKYIQRQDIQVEEKEEEQEMVLLCPSKKKKIKLEDDYDDNLNDSPPIANQININIGQTVNGQIIQTSNDLGENQHKGQGKVHKSQNQNSSNATNIRNEQQVQVTRRITRNSLQQLHQY